jgi:adenosine deaminase
VPVLPSRAHNTLHAIALILVLAAAGVDTRGQRQPAAPADSAASAEQRITRVFERVRKEPPALRAFLRAMPKGADLHTHLTGAVYAESYVRWAAALPLCVEVSTAVFVAASSPSAGAGAARATCKDPVRQRPASDALQDPVLYRTLIDAMSVRNWDSARAPGHDQFFDTFVKFDAVTREGADASADVIGKAVAEVTHRAALQNVQHLELMMAMAGEAQLAPDPSALEGDADFRGMRDRLIADGIRQRVSERRRWIDAVESRARAALRCGTPSAMPGCDLSVRFIPTALRALPPPQVFAQALFSFELVAGDERSAGVNLVMPEDWHVPMRDYDLHMRMFRYLKTAYPGVNVSLHAGELTLGLVPPEMLGLHVRQAIQVGGAQRIGHGTDVMYDVNPAALLREMASKRIAVEIILSSSDVILGIRGTRHPMRQYLRAGVPVVIATDDEGVARSDLTNEYQRAVEEQGLTYRELKTISRNSIEYSFLRPDEKARLKRQLDAALARFEATYARMN